MGLLRWPRSMQAEGRELLCFKAGDILPEAYPRKTMRRGVMRQIALLHICVCLVFVGACGSKEDDGGRQTNVDAFLRKTEGEIIEMLGEPSGEGKPLPSFENYPEEIAVREVLPAPERRFWLREKLQPPLEWLEVTFSEEGRCDSV